MSDGIKGVVAVTGACSDLGTAILRDLSDEPAITKLLALDVAAPDVLSDKIEFHHVDLCQPDSEHLIAAILSEHAPQLVIHGALTRQAHHDEEVVSQLEGLGSARLLSACRQAPPARLLLLSTTLVYGAHPDNPNYLGESAPLRGIAPASFVNNKILIESQFSAFAQEHPEVQVCTLRFAPTIGSGCTNLFTRFLSRPIVPRIAGFDPLMQIVHADDALAAALLACHSTVRGALNIVSAGVLPFSALLAELGRIPIPMPKPIAKLVGDLMWHTRTSEVPASMLSMLQYSCVADGSRAEETIGFRPRHDIRSTLREFLGTETAPLDTTTPSSSPYFSSSTRPWSQP